MGGMCAVCVVQCLCGTCGVDSVYACLVCVVYVYGVTYVGVWYLCCGVMVVSLWR